LGSKSAEGYKRRPGCQPGKAETEVSASGSRSSSGSGEMEGAVAAGNAGKVSVDEDVR